MDSNDATQVFVQSISWKVLGKSSDAAAAVVAQSQMCSVNLVGLLGLSLSGILCLLAKVLFNLDLYYLSNRNDTFNLAFDLSLLSLLIAYKSE